ncbi:MAG: hypothetical protein HC890_11780 [Chloroflexaceae bacterium]|nr:hypothetical protein [Chloroflexaceae bacterium]
MKTEFYFDRRKYSCAIAEVQGVNELRIRNPEGSILAVQQGKTVGLIGKTRKDAKIVSVMEPRLYNLIKAATTAINLTKIDRYLREKELLLREKTGKLPSSISNWPFCKPKAIASP